MKFVVQIIAGAFFLSLSSVGMTAEIPLNDGRYVTESSLCPLSDEDMVERYGDGISIMVRNIKGLEINDAYEMYCEVTRTSMRGREFFFDATCLSEDYEYPVRNAKYTILDSEMFRLNGQTFVRCETDEATASGPIAEFVEHIVRAWHVANTQCRGGSISLPVTQELCDAREKVGELLRDRNWCYGKEEEAGYQMSWHECVANSIR